MMLRGVSFARDSAGSIVPLHTGPNVSPAFVTAINPGRG